MKTQLSAVRPTVHTNPSTENALQPRGIMIPEDSGVKEKEFERVEKYQNLANVVMVAKNTYNVKNK